MTEAASRGWEPISANFLMPAWVKTHWPKYVEGCEKGGRPADPANWRVAQIIFVADDRREGARVRDGAEQPLPPVLRQPADQAEDGRPRARPSRTTRTCPTTRVTPDYVVDKLVIWGSPEKVAEKLLAFREEVGDFGTLLYAGKDWLDRDLGRRSMVLMAEKVLPKLNAAIGK